MQLRCTIGIGLSGQAYEYLILAKTPQRNTIRELFVLNRDFFTVDFHVEKSTIHDAILFSFSLKKNIITIRDITVVVSQITPDQATIYATDGHQRYP